MSLLREWTQQKWTRRRFFLSTLAGGLAALRLRSGQAAARQPVPQGGTTAGWLSGSSLDQETPKSGIRPLMVASANGVKALDRGMAILKKGGDTLESVLAAVTVVEDDPNDDTVGYGGLPNEDGEVELDASVMHGPTRKAGAVGALKEVKNPSQVAKHVMERTDHIMLVGPGALRFAVAHGFPRMNLLTERSRVAWLAWKETLSDRDAWGPGLDSPEWKERVAGLLPPSLSDAEKVAWMDHIREVILHPPMGTINCLAVDEKGDLSGCTSTSGLAWKIAGRVGDSPIIGAGLYVDNDVGAAGSTGRGEENIKVSGAHTIVELMRKGMAPREACLEALGRVARNYRFDPPRLRRFYVVFYALSKDGVHGGASLWAESSSGKRRTYAVHDGREAKLVDCAALFQGRGG